MLQEALEPFCEGYKDLRPTLAHPFRQKDGDGRDCIFASDGHVLICIYAKEAGVAIGTFKPMDEFNSTKVIPFVGFEDILTARTVRRESLRKTIDQMKQWESEKKQVASARLQGVELSIEALSHIEVAMRICGLDAARLVWNKNGMVMLTADNAKGQTGVNILHMGWSPEGAHVIDVPTDEGCQSEAVRISWQRGSAEWANIKAEQEREQEAERMARREVYLVQVQKIAYIPVYAKNADEARQMVDGDAWFDPEDDGDDEWFLGDEVPETEDLDDLDDCYKHVITRDGVVHRDEIYNLEQISEEWQKQHGKENV